MRTSELSSYAKYLTEKKNETKNYWQNWNRRCNSLEKMNKISPNGTKEMERVNIIEFIRVYVNMHQLCVDWFGIHRFSFSIFFFFSVFLSYLILALIGVSVSERFIFAHHLRNLLPTYPHFILTGSIFVWFSRIFIYANIYVNIHDANT